MSTESLINAELSIGSLMVLGFNANDYIENYPGIAYGVANLTVYTFDKQNEKSLLVALHFLLSKLEPVEFVESIQSCWPFLDLKSKNEFKRAVQASFDRLVHKNWLTTGICKASILTTARGPDVWTLLRVLSDICVEVSIAEFNHEELDVVAHRYYATVDIRGAIEDELKLLESVIVSGIQVERDHSKYFSELDTRLRKATKNIEISRKKLQLILTNDIPQQILTEAGRAQRAEWIEKITNSKQLLLNLALSPLLIKAKELLAADRITMQAGLLPIQNKVKLASITPERWATIFSNAGQGFTEQELAGQRTILDAVNDLIDQIDMIPVV